jgi:glycosyltransferase involved in cell wall biosynthesis
MPRRSAEAAPGAAAAGGLLLASGLPLRRSTSFSRQLGRLAAAWAEQGEKAVVVGPAGPAASEAGGLPGGARAAILLGYPDQFPLLASAPRAGLPLYLWAQFSRPPPAAALGGATAVPLTPQTRRFLRAAGHERIGPVIPHGVDCRLYRPLGARERRKLRESRGLEGSFVVGAVGANSRRKRFDLLIQAFAGLLERRPRALLVIKTDRRVSLDGMDLPALAARQGLGDRLMLLTEELGEPRMVELYNLLDLYLCLSEWEGFCIPVIEAMACAVPVARHAVQGPGETVPYAELLVPGSRGQQQGGSRLLVADPRAAAAVLLQAAGDPGLLRRLGERGRAEAEERYDLRRVVEQWERLLGC